MSERFEIITMHLATAALALVAAVLAFLPALGKAIRHIQKNHRKRPLQHAPVVLS